MASVSSEIEVIGPAARGGGQQPVSSNIMSLKATSSTAVRRLMTEYKQLTSSGAPEGLFTAGPTSESNFFEWEALIQGPEETPFEGGVFLAKLSFPSDYPMSPFKMKFDPPILHPNGTHLSIASIPSRPSLIKKFDRSAFDMLHYANGEVCISILHAPGDDPNMYETSSERWSPVQSVEKVLLSVISMLAEPNVESGANIDCCKLFRDDREEYERRVRKLVEDQLGL